MTTQLEAWLTKLTTSKIFNRASIGLILFSAILLGLETNQQLYETYKSFFILLDRIVLSLFTIEISFRLGSHLTSPARFFKDGWNLFDLLIVVLCYLPVGGPFASIARLVRVLRALRLITHFPQLRLIVETMIRSLSSLGYIALLLALVFYVYAIAGIFSFGSVAPDYFGGLSKTFMTLFQIVTLEGWVDIMKIVSGSHPIFAPLYFVSFIIVGTMIVLNLFIGVIVNSLSEAQQQTQK